ncbi:CoA-transferase, partial [Streptomyces sp. NPDC127079]
MDELSKLRTTAEAALAGVLTDGMTIAVGGFGLCGVPYDLI